MTKTIRLTMAQALVKFMQAQKVEVDGQLQPIFEGVFAIFGHGNVAGLGEALFHVNDELPTYRAHNEQAMAHSAIAFAKANNRRRMMAATTSVGPGALNMVTAAALAHVNRLPVLLLPGDTFATREPDPVLQQVEDWSDATITPNDCFKPVSRFFDRITRPEQLLNSLPQAMRVLTDPVECGPVTLSLPQDVQTMAFDYPEHFFAEKVHRIRRPGADEHELQLAIESIAQAKQPLVIAGGGIHYAEATQEFSDFVEAFGLPVGETQAGKGALAWDHPSNLGSIGVTGSEAVNTLASEADVVIAVGTRLQDFTSSSRALFRSDAKIVSLNVNGFDATKHYSTPLVADAKHTLPQLGSGLIGWNICPNWKSKAESLRLKWNETVEIAMTDRQSELPTDAEVIGAVNRAAQEKDIVVCAAGGLPGELHKLWRTRYDKGYHLEYGFSCMGYEIAGGLGVKMAKPDSEVFVMVGDGSYLMLNSEIATSVMLGQKLVVVVLDNRGYGCINRLQQACGGAGFNNLLQDCNTVEAGAPKTDFAGHARSLGASAEKVGNITELEQALIRARAADSTYVITLDTDPLSTTESGGSWWEVAVPEVSVREPVREARKRYEAAKKDQVI
ncbi:MULTISPECIES: 3D-(3,5/4)-trihydroxycyclohexane-1,2-dione acylhydrolase (decyclizing) [Vibrio]|uniref:3D-(3,5/4)-trihydroxycyclohexane-1,2-dione acylhydrolase (decyclizing) n=1 Tax=Vibrio TaxID=662 RepID=UPI0001B94C7E|nr:MULTISPECIES: 3D-(3,5/4)-trihydroxycyclohexane-1,2-dione acylhydrolase (decyclizing) [Vibrio]EEX31441.1 epi-inositol hydrolase [Vibrio coralliilyticus ATCC BAA-450]MCM5506886.1 3D-(3,5/4)-trihydroxycyclohexane-1,2-dione acylhydrolase (decyclizing) [Vibrio sp. SCSIO 43169]MDE3896640.1 3D-(3,5/4)-trihydroxycyclohexane-1,2-dione acylhydrolase (decyclizing) [Vibrio sp. CC007]QFT36774.1 3D-(3,5/4)-trihydroxycyclohexane-1,2-dione hydrolase [Vibrio sp. THAF64]QGM34675.1 3D-(3,5/4)-trihydroxycycloh